MHVYQARKLKPGDVVFYDDNGGECAREVTIAAIKVHPVSIDLTTDDGSEIECYARELTLVSR